MAAYDNFIFDFYGTLVDIHTNESKAFLWKKLALILSGMGFPYEWKQLKKDYMRFVDEETEKMASEFTDMSVITRPEYKSALTKSCPPIEVNGEIRKPEIELRKVFRQLMSPWTTDAEIDEFAVTFRALSLEYIRVYDEIFDIFDLLRSKGKKIFLLSNAQACFTVPEMRTLGLYDLFDDIFLSSDLGSAKPDPRFLRSLVKKHDLDISKSIMIGNDYNSDVAIANSLGMDSFYIHTATSPAVKDDKDIPATYVDQKSGELQLKHFRSLI